MRILVVEDEKVIANNLKKGLVSENFAVDILENGLEALEQAKQEEYDVILLDVMLPDMDGITICEELRKAKVSTPILILTAKDTIESKIEGLERGADDYMVKPFSFDELLARIRSLIRRNNQAEPELRIDSLSLNPTTHIVKRGDEEITLTGKEYALLEYFMHHPNQILSREQIINHVWDYTYDSMSNVIEVLIRRLRNKIDKAYPQEKQLFTTIRGLGYKISDAQ